MACVTVFPLNAVISTRLPDSVPIFTAEIWKSLKPWNKLKILKHPNIIFLQAHFCVSEPYSI